MAVADASGFLEVKGKEGTLPIEDFDAMVETHRPRVFRFALASLRDRDLAESVTQDCFVNAHRAWSSFRGAASIQTWLMQIAVNLVRDVTRSRRLQFRKRAQASIVDLDDASNWVRDCAPSPEDQAETRQRVAAIWSVVEGLSE